MGQGIALLAFGNVHWPFTAYDRVEFGKSLKLKLELISSILLTPAHVVTETTTSIMCTAYDDGNVPRLYA